MNADPVLTIELRLLVYTALVSLVVWVPYILAEIKTRGLVRAVGYPSGVVDDLPAWAQRNHRAHLNLVENLAPFAVLVLVAHVTGVSNGATVLGAQLFFWSRVVHIAVMIAGIPWVRTLAFAAGLLGNLIILGQILYA
ncbi:MAG: MAPEG family protein [Rhodospirillales bacterium]|nr:MAPEG family protein [Rhodospirillales bacterium]